VAKGANLRSVVSQGEGAAVVAGFHELSAGGRAS
jgi:hypothetical protein